LEAAEKPFQAVILSEAKNLALSIFKTMRDPSSPATPQDDSRKGFFRRLFNPAVTDASHHSSVSPPAQSRSRAESAARLLSVHPGSCRTRALIEAFDRLWPRIEQTLLSGKRVVEIR
jgi:hypothetical protein